MGPVTSWCPVTPTTGQVAQLLDLYGCTLAVDGSLFVVTHASGRCEKVASLDEVVDAAVKLARSA